MNFSRKRMTLLALVLSVVLLPLLIVTAFSASLAVVPTYPPIIQNVNISYYNQTEYSLYYYNQTTGQPPALILFPTIPSIYITYIVIALFAIAAFVLVYNVRISIRRNLAFSSLTVEDVNAQKSEIAKVLDNTVYKLREGGEYRKTVLECYKIISEILETKSEIEGRALTAREFKKLASEKLALHSPYLDEVTNLFEAARYSTDEVTDTNAKEAILCLQNLSDELKDSRIGEE